MMAKLHVASAVLALAAGLAVFFRRKGGRAHRAIGYVYTAAMVVMLLTAFLIYNLFGGFGPFHVAAVVSSAVLVAGFVPVFLRRPKDRWLEWHYGYMCMSYVGLVAAGVAEVLVRVPGAPFWGTVAGASAAVAFAGIGLVSRFEKPMLERFPAGTRRPAAAREGGGRTAAGVAQSAAPHSGD